MTDVAVRARIRYLRKIADAPEPRVGVGKTLGWHLAEELAKEGLVVITMLSHGVFGVTLTETARELIKPIQKLPNKPQLTKVQKWWLDALTDAAGRRECAALLRARATQAHARRTVDALAQRGFVVWSGTLASIRVTTESGTP